MLLVIMTCICMCIRFIFLFYMSIWYHIALFLCTIRLSYFVRNDEIKMFNHIFGKMSLNNHPTIAHNTRHIYLVQRGGCLVMSYVTSPVFQACRCVLCVVACYISKCLRIINFILLHLERNYRQKGKYTCGVVMVSVKILKPLVFPAYSISHIMCSGDLWESIVG